MSVLKSKRKESQFEVLHHLTKMRKEVTDLLLRDFGYDYDKSEKVILKWFGGRAAEDEEISTEAHRKGIYGLVYRVVQKSL